MSREKIESNGLIFTWNQKCSCYQFSLPPRQSCPGVIERLKNPRNICNYCYAYWGRSGLTKKPIKTLAKNLKTVKSFPFSELFERFRNIFKKLPEGTQFFRWFGCGDLVSVRLEMVVVWLAYAYPSIKFWCPTQVHGFTLHNLAGRLTNGIIGLPAPDGGHTTLLPEQKTLPGHFVCPGKCGPCRKCWELKGRIAFPFHGSACLMAKFNKARRIHKF